MTSAFKGPQRAAAYLLREAGRAGSARRRMYSGVGSAPFCVKKRMEERGLSGDGRERKVGKFSSSIVDRKESDQAVSDTGLYGALLQSRVSFEVILPVLLAHSMCEIAPVGLEMWNPIGFLE